ncbi:MAG: peptidylprolyl isomerase [Alphaproteobacteria bacterium]|nr:peptidylprolyl isomerase [Alphaproteobacteria bacterium]
MHVRALALPVLVLALGLGCGGESPTSSPSEAPAEAEAPSKAEAPAEAQTPAKAAPAAAADGSASLRDPSAFTAEAPPTYTVRLDTTAGEVLVDVERAWAPLGADRFYNLVKGGFYDGVAFFRVIDNFMAQVGLHGDPEVNVAWRMARIKDDPVTQSNTRGMVTFATAGPNTRTTQIFFNYKDNRNLDAMGFAPFGKVRDMTALDALYKGYGEGAPSGRGPNQGRIQQEGARYLEAEFPNLSYIRKAEIVE